MKAIKCDICGKIIDIKKEPLFFELRKSYKLFRFIDEREEEVESDICSDCYLKIKHYIRENLWKEGAPKDSNFKVNSDNYT